MAKILVVDDESSLRSLYRNEFESEGYAVVTAPTGEEAILALQHESPDLVVLDFRTYDWRGLTTVRRLLGIKGSVPVVLNTGSASYGDEFANWAADAVVVKSSDTRELRAKIRELLDTVLGGADRPAVTAEGIRPARD